MTTTTSELASLKQTGVTPTTISNTENSITSNSSTLKTNPMMIQSQISSLNFIEKHRKIPFDITQEGELIFRDQPTPQQDLDEKIKFILSRSGTKPPFGKQQEIHDDDQEIKFLAPVVEELKYSLFAAKEELALTFDIVRRIIQSIQERQTPSILGAEDTQKQQNQNQGGEGELVKSITATWVQSDSSKPPLDQISHRKAILMEKNEHLTKIYQRCLETTKTLAFKVKKESLLFSHVSIKLRKHQWLLRLSTTVDGKSLFIDYGYNSSGSRFLERGEAFLINTSLEQTQQEVDEEIQQMQEQYELDGPSYRNSSSALSFLYDNFSLTRKDKKPQPKKQKDSNNNTLNSGAIGSSNKASSSTTTGDGSTNNLTAKLAASAKLIIPHKKKRFVLLSITSILSGEVLASSHGQWIDWDGKINVFDTMTNELYDAQRNIFELELFREIQNEIHTLHTKKHIPCLQEGKSLIFPLSSDKCLKIELTDSVPKRKETEQQNNQLYQEKKQLSENNCLMFELLLRSALRKRHHQLLYLKPQEKVSDSQFVSNILDLYTQQEAERLIQNTFKLLQRLLNPLRYKLVIRHEDTPVHQRGHVWHVFSEYDISCGHPAILKLFLDSRCQIMVQVKNNVNTVPIPSSALSEVLEPILHDQLKRTILEEISEKMNNLFNALGRNIVCKFERVNHELSFMKSADQVHSQSLSLSNTTYIDMLVSAVKIRSLSGSLNDLEAIIICPQSLGNPIVKKVTLLEETKIGISFVEEIMNQILSLTL